MKPDAEEQPKHFLPRAFGKFKKSFSFARTRGGSLGGIGRLLYHAGLKSPLVARGLASFHDGRILCVPFRADAGTTWQVHLRDNGLDILTLAEFFSPETFIAEEFPDREPAVIYDIGANIGVSSLFFSARYPRATIYGFEPLPSNYEICAMNFRNLSRGRVFQSALGSSTGTATFEFEAADNRGGRLAASSVVNAKRSSQSIAVEVLTLVDAIREKKLAPPEMIKIDVEGAELEVLKGVGSHVDSVKAIHLETHGPELRTESLRWLREQGFSIIGQREEQPGYGAIWSVRS